MCEQRSVVITGASRGLGLASAAHLYQRGWRVVAALRTPEPGLQALRSKTGAAAGDPRLIAIPLDLTDYASVAAAAKAIESTVGAPHALVHNAGISAAGMAEETPMDLWERMFATGDRAPFARHAVGADARMLVVANRLLSSKALHRVTRLAMGIPRPGALSSASSNES
ncbi:hypothetical protein MLAC_07280 [Mycobacterium lacus]|uniref:Short-chain dehydrogenase n=2 Tax=Mycobacterium lacus TaxID=169765 RepID=A0A7I7NFW8_9MYCO|nr:SDR family NAD(P)-dependent oxidoreductase [Mycobacterium lacus]MCV7123775.1 SDR family NAD(P)-dependent oxidoreductase [Mycobacterium lacus]BBX95434.1 hypothetical protein MLAC_07280 [Mycobacterium lacus]